MKRMTIVVLLGFVSACGAAESSDDRSGTGGVAGAGGSGGVAVIPADVDQLCRDFCANEAEGEDCGVENCSRFIDYCSSGSGQPLQQCYEGCLMEYSERVEPLSNQPRCPEEWVAHLSCVVNEHQCNDAFGDCDALESASECPIPSQDCRDACSGIEQEIEACLRACDAMVCDACDNQNLKGACESDYDTCINIDRGGSEECTVIGLSACGI